MTTKEIDKLFADTLLGDYDDEAPWAAVSKLRLNGNQYIFEKASAWCLSPDPLERSRGGDVLSQLRSPKTPEQEQSKAFADPIFVDESYKVVCDMIQHETDERALTSEIYALGHLGLEGAVSLILPYANHASGQVRFAVTFSLGKFTSSSEAIRSLIKLSVDTDSDVRDWSTFALGSFAPDTNEIREALALRLDDPDKDTREEAISGLARHRDPRALPKLIESLQDGWFGGSLSEAADYFLELDRSPDGWEDEEYLAALKARYPEVDATRSPS